PADGDAIAARYTGDPEALLRQLCADRLLVQICLPNAEQPWHWILTEEWALYRDAFLTGDRRPATDDSAELFRGQWSRPGGPVDPARHSPVRIDGDREVPLEEAVPAVFREGESEGDEVPEVREG